MAAETELMTYKEALAEYLRLQKLILKHGVDTALEFDPDILVTVDNLEHKLAGAARIADTYLEHVTPELYSGHPGNILPSMVKLYKQHVLKED